MSTFNRYQPSFWSRVLDVLDAVLYALFVLFKGIFRITLWIGAVGILYLGPIALVWALYRGVAGYFFPGTWSIALREPAFWPVVALVTLVLLLGLLVIGVMILIRGGGATLTIYFPSGSLKLWWKNDDQT